MPSRCAAAARSDSSAKARSSAPFSPPFSPPFSGFLSCKIESNPIRTQSLTSAHQYRPRNCGGRIEFSGGGVA
eukprot:9497022-Pyramimonas_sp.AAC.2